MKTTARFIHCMSVVVVLGISSALADAPAPGDMPPAKPAQKPATPLNYLSPIRNGREIIAQFHDAYEKEQKPRLVLHVNQDLLPEQRLAITPRSDNEPAPTDAPAPAGPGKGTTPLSEFETRQVEEIFRRSFVAGGATFVDDRVAAPALKSYPATGDRLLPAPTTDADKNAQAALKQNADIVIELLVRRYTVLYPTPAGDTTIQRLDLVATAFDLKEGGVILGQISSESLFGFNQPGGTRRAVSDLEVIDQTSLALMDQLVH